MSAPGPHDPTLGKYSRNWLYISDRSGPNPFEASDPREGVSLVAFGTPEHAYLTRQPQLLRRFFDEGPSAFEGDDKTLSGVSAFGLSRLGPLLTIGASLFTFTSQNDLITVIQSPNAKVGLAPRSGGVLSYHVGLVEAWDKRSAPDDVFYDRGLPDFRFEKWRWEGIPHALTDFKSLIEYVGFHAIPDTLTTFPTPDRLCSSIQDWKANHAASILYIPDIALIRAHEDSIDPRAILDKWGEKRVPISAHSFYGLKKGRTTLNLFAAMVYGEPLLELGAEYVRAVRSLERIPVSGPEQYAEGPSREFAAAMEWDSLVRHLAMSRLTGPMYSNVCDSVVATLAAAGRLFETQVARELLARNIAPQDINGVLVGQQLKDSARQRMGYNPELSSSRLA